VLKNNKDDAPRAKRWPILRILGLALGLLVLIMGLIGALAVLWGGKDGVVQPELKREAPTVRQFDRNSLRHAGRRGGEH